MLEKECVRCGKIFQKTKDSRKQWEKRKFCSLDCCNLEKKNINGALSHRWKGGISKTSHGYLLQNIKGGNNYQHRIVVENFLKRKLLSNEDVHHINKNKKDNRIENLMVVDRKTHSRLEKGWQIIEKKWWKICTGCQSFLEIKKENFWLRKSNEFVYLCKKCCNQRSKEWKRKKAKNKRCGIIINESACVAE